MATPVSELKRPEHFERYLGSDVQVRLYKAADGSKTWSGKLTGFADGNVLDVIVDADYVDDELGDVCCILSLRKK